MPSSQRDEARALSHASRPLQLRTPGAARYARGALLILLMFGAVVALACWAVVK